MAEQGSDASAGSSTAPSWTVREIRGRRSGTRDGLAAVHSVTAQRADGAEFMLGRVDVSEDQAVELDVLSLARPMRFDRCPICLEPGPTSREHLPPAALGGSVMTWTCHRCNNQLGSMLESELVDWWEDAIGSVSFSRDDVAGHRRASRMLIRQKDTGEPALVLHRGIDPAITSMLTSDGARRDEVFSARPESLSAGSAEERVPRGVSCGSVNPGDARSNGGARRIDRSSRSPS